MSCGLVRTLICYGLKVLGRPEQVTSAQSRSIASELQLSFGLRAATLHALVSGLATVCCVVLERDHSTRGICCFPVVPAVVARGLLEKWCVCHELVTMRFMLELSNFSLDGMAVYCIKLNGITMDSVLF